ncbi:MAG: asparagine synthase-related protein [Acidimicrobiales bacterium]
MASPLLYGARPGIAFGKRRNIQKLLRAVGDRRPPHYWRMMAQLTFGELAGLVPGAAKGAFDELDAQSPWLETASLTEALAFDRAQFLPNLNLAYVDKASMAASIEVRVPMLDELVTDATFAASLESSIQRRCPKSQQNKVGAGYVGLIPRMPIESIIPINIVNDHFNAATLSDQYPVTERELV